MPRLDLWIDDATDAALRQIAAQEGGDRMSLIRDAIRRDLFRRARAKKAVRPDERLIAPLRALLAEDFAYAQDWVDLQARLADKGYTLREAGAGLALHCRGNGEKRAKASDLGYSYSRLMRRFRAPFPGHSHAYLFKRTQ
jgi:hypothetical protein